MSGSAREELIASLTKDELIPTLSNWRFWARDEQLAPDGDWRIWRPRAEEIFPLTFALAYYGVDPDQWRAGRGIRK